MKIGLTMAGTEETKQVAVVRKDPKKERRFYKANDRPPIFLAILFGFQQVMVCVSALLTIPFILSNELCPGRDVYNLRVKLISSTFVVSGISTIIQTMFGMRLALLQGTAFAYIPSIQVFMLLPEYKCTASENDFVPVEDYENKLAIFKATLSVLSAHQEIVFG
ncbi:Solute carrier family 23 member 1 [Toxocara canis]|uniref:Solute carrier family 23 member 1 n=1 Tax=Toxocara canis TaxID=6265 RepID=A0A0B2VLF6_TOXCA|nr:Solute carrier family 23 member 1 [Toxocara canis]